MSDPYFSIVCPSYQGENKLRDLLTAIYQGTSGDQEIFETIIVLDASTDNSQEVIAGFKNEFPEFKISTHVNLQNLGPASSRNEGAEISKGEILLFLDDDCRPSREWFNDVAKVWKNASEKSIAAGGLVTPNKREFFTERYSEVFNSIQPWALAPEKYDIFRRLSDYYRGADLEKRGIEYFAGANFSIRKAAFLRVGGFPSQLRAGEDIAICQAIRNEYGQDSLLYESTLVMHHEYPQHFSELLAKKFRYGKLLSRAMANGELTHSLNPGPAIVLTLWLVCFIVLKILDAAGSPLSILLLALSISTLYSSFVVGMRKGVKRFSPQYLLFGAAFFLIEMANNFGFIYGLVIRSKELKKKY